MNEWIKWLGIDKLLRSLIGYCMSTFGTGIKSLGVAFGATDLTSEVFISEALQGLLKQREESVWRKLAGDSSSRGGAWGTGNEGLLTGNSFGDQWAGLLPGTLLNSDLELLTQIPF